MTDRKALFVVGFAEFSQQILISQDQSRFFCTRPFFELSFALSGGREIGMGFNPENGHRRIELGCSAGVASLVFQEAEFEIFRTPSVKSFRPEKQDVGKGDAP